MDNRVAEPLASGQHPDEVMPLAGPLPQAEHTDAVMSARRTQTTAPVVSTLSRSKPCTPAGYAAAGAKREARPALGTDAESVCPLTTDDRWGTVAHGMGNLWGEVRHGRTGS